MVALFQRLSNPRGALTNSSVETAEIASDAPSGDSAPPSDRVRQRQIRLTPQQVAALVQLYQSGASVQQCAIAFGIHRTTVMSQLERQGVPRRPNLRKLTDQDLKRVLERHRAGESAASIARSYDVDPETVRRAIKRAG